MSIPVVYAVLSSEEMLSSLRVDRESAERRPYEEQLRDWLKENIESGRWASGQALPSVTQIMEHTGVGRGTVSLAMKALIQEGLIEGRKGKGRYVARRRIVVRNATARLANFLEGLGAYEGEIKRQGRTPSVEVLKISTEPASDAVAGLLEVSASTPVLVRGRLYYDDGRPVQVATSYLPDELVVQDSRIRQEDTGPGGIYARLVEESGIWYSGWEEMPHPSRPPLRQERQLLQLPIGAQIWPVDRVARDEDGRPVELCRSLYAATEDMTFVYEIPMREVLDHFQERYGWLPDVPE